jgi:CheY-like chemotaxis protein
MNFNFFNLFKEPSDELPTASNLFNDEKESKEIKPSITSSCTTCSLGKNGIEKITPDINCNWVVTLNDYDETKQSILVVDDNPGIISFMIDDIESLNGSKLNIDDYNIITFDTVNAAYYFEATQHRYKGLNIKYAILDLTLGGSIISSDGPVKYTGVDIYQQILIYNPEVKVLFYTGNNLNEYIKSNKKLIEQFSNLTNGKKIKDYILFKTALDLDGRRKFLGDWFR